MKDNSNSGLRIKHLIVILPTLIVSVFCAQIFLNNRIIVKDVEPVAELKIDGKFQEVARVTSRSAEERKLEKVEEEVVEEENKYITIDEISISRDMDLTQRCGISKEDFKKLMTDLRVDSSGFFEENSDIIYDLCEEYELNEIFFCGLIAAESGWNIASNHRNANNYISMMSKGRLIRYSTPEEGLRAAARLLHNNYLSPSGSFYYGNTLSCVQRRFCPNSSTWVGLVYGCMKQVVK